MQALDHLIKSHSQDYGFTTITLKVPDGAWLAPVLLKNRTVTVFAADTHALKKAYPAGTAAFGTPSETISPTVAPVSVMV